jgi:uncharacterized protein YbjQ (UPF0145 family)
MFELIGFATLLTIGYFVGSSREAKHLQNLIEREKQLLRISVIAEEKADGNVAEAFLVTGEVVIASDYFKNFSASLKSVFGGRLTTFESLMDRGRREAMLRLKEQAVRKGADEIVGLRLMMTAIDQFGIEVLATGTAIKRVK